MSAPLRMLVVWKDPVKDPFLANMKVTVRQGGAGGTELTQAKDSKAPRLAFDIDPSVTHIRVEVQIPSPDTIHAPGDLVNFWQEIDVKDLTVDKKPVRGLSATSCSRSGRSDHPRVKLTEPWAKGASGVAAVELDVRFLNITTYAASLLGRGFDRFSASTRNRCKWFVYAHTQGVPAVWAVGVTPPVTQGEFNVNAMLFFQNELQDRMVLVGRDAEGHEDWEPSMHSHYTAVEDLDFGRLEKYMNQGGAPSDNLRGRYFGFVPRSSTLIFRPYPSFGWDDLLAEAGKPLVFLFPFPQGQWGVDFGAAGDARSAEPLLASLFRALQVDSVVASQTTNLPRLKRLAIGGWSSGMVTAMSWVDTDQRGIVDEAYFFDAETTVQKRLAADTKHSIMKSWFNKKLPAGPDGPRTRILRMIGTGYTEGEYNDIAAAIGSKDCTSRPNDTEYWYTNATYTHAHSKPPPIMSTTEPEEKFDTLSPTATATTPATAFSNVFIANLTTTNVNTGTTTGRTTSSLKLGSPGLESRSVPAIAHVEAAALARFVISTTASSQATFDTIISEMQTMTGNEPNVVKRHRHPWSVFGGTGSGTLGTFKGYLQLCLESSKFT